MAVTDIGAGSFVKNGSQATTNTAVIATETTAKYGSPDTTPASAKKCGSRTTKDTTVEATTTIAETAGIGAIDTIETTATTTESVIATTVTIDMNATAIMLAATSSPFLLRLQVGDHSPPTPRDDPTS